MLWLVQSGSLHNSPSFPALVSVRQRSINLLLPIRDDTSDKRETTTDHGENNNRPETLWSVRSVRPELTNGQLPRWSQFVDKGLPTHFIFPLHPSVERAKVTLETHSEFDCGAVTLVVSSIQRWHNSPSALRFHRAEVSSQRCSPNSLYLPTSSLR